MVRSGRIAEKEGFLVDLWHTFAQIRYFIDGLWSIFVYNYFINNVEDDLWIAMSLFN